MTEQETIEGNKLIDEFMGFKGFRQSMQYHSSWDWLIPACKKFDKIKSEIATSDKLKWGSLMGQIVRAINEFDITKTHKNLISAIKWYNQNKKL